MAAGGVAPNLCPVNWGMERVSIYNVTCPLGKGDALQSRLQCEEKGKRKWIPKSWSLETHISCHSGDDSYRKQPEKLLGASQRCFVMSDMRCRMVFSKQARPLLDPRSAAVQGPTLFIISSSIWWASPKHPEFCISLHRTESLPSRSS